MRLTLEDMALFERITARSIHGKMGLDRSVGSLEEGRIEQRAFDRNKFMNLEGLAKRLRRPIRQMFWGMGALLRRARGTRWERRVSQALYQLRAGYDNASFDMARNGELWLLDRLAELHPSVLLDIGANRGGWSLAAAARCNNAAVHAFEPVPATYELLVDAVGAKGNIRPYSLALGEQAGELQLWVPAASGE